MRRRARGARRAVEKKCIVRVVGSTGVVDVAECTGPVKGCEDWTGCGWEVLGKG